MPCHDVICRDCGLIQQNIGLKSWPDAIMHLDSDHVGQFEILWSFGSKQLAAVHASERAVVWYHPKHGYRYPGMNNTPMPDYYQKWGFERKELPHLSDVKKLERDGDVLSEINNFDKGTGRDFMGG